MAARNCDQITFASRDPGVDNSVGGVALQQRFVDVLRVKDDRVGRRDEQTGPGQRWVNGRGWRTRHSDVMRREHEVTWIGGKRRDWGVVSVVRE